MDNIEIEDFCHHDFTTASDWEVFIARLEEIMQQWDLPNTKIGPPLNPGDFMNCKWLGATDCIHFADVPFTLTYYKLNLEEQEIDFDESDEEAVQCHKDALNTSNDFANLYGTDVELASYYGIREFLVLKCCKVQYIMDETKTKILLSSFAIATSNVNCDIPTFVYVTRKRRDMYQGISIGTGACTHFDMISLQPIPQNYKYLTGLLALFKEKVGKGCGINLDPVTLSVRFSYKLLLRQSVPDYQLELGKLPFISCAEVLEVTLYTTWPKMSENVIVDREDFTDLQPRFAPEWSLLIESRSVNTFHQAGHLATLLSLNFSPIAHRKCKLRENAKGSILENTLSPILSFLFPDPEVNPDALYSDLTTSSLDENQWKGVKTCAIDSLVWRLSICLSYCETKQEFERLWYKFMDEIMSRWERNILIPGVSPGFPDYNRTCLLHQKLQMINCCIERKIAREELACKRESIDDDRFESESDDEIFFECNRTPSDEEFRTPTFQMFHKPEGRLTKHPSIKIIQTGEPLYEPVTQDPVPKTEDQLNKDMEVMMQFGTDQEASDIRARLMSDSLLSDMEAFKAANPGAYFEDFIRWYSPKDFIEIDEMDEWNQPEGNLSERMSSANNPWLATWKKAKPVPAHRQKPLFDDKREAVKILYFLNTANMDKDVVILLLPVLLHAGLYTIIQNAPFNITNNDIILSVLNKLRRDTQTIPQTRELYEDLLREIGRIEGIVSTTNLCLRILDVNGESEEFTSFASKLIQGKEAKVPGGSTGYIGSGITKIFDAEANKEILSELPTIEATDKAVLGYFPTHIEPLYKEIILRTIAPRPSPNSRPQPQRLYALLEGNVILLAGFFSEDTIFV